MLRQQHTRRTLRSRILRALARVSLLLSPVAAMAGEPFVADRYANAPAYVKAVDHAVSLDVLATVGQMLPKTGNPDAKFRLVGIPDGMGIYEHDFGIPVLLLNHEFSGNQGAAAGPLPSGARASELLLGVKKHGCAAIPKITSGRYAIEEVFKPIELDDVDGDLYAKVANPPAMARLCSAFLADEKVGFSEPIFLHGEENSALAGSFDPKGSSAFATFGGATYQLARLGHMAFENAVAANGTSPTTTVVFCLEDGPSGFRSQLYMYVGEKISWSADPLLANGLTNGKLYVFASNNPAVNTEGTFTTKTATVTGHWTQVDFNLDVNQLETAAQAAGAFGFIRIEDGANDPSHPGTFYFDTTGGTAPNRFGRLYKLAFDPLNPTGAASLTLVLDGSEGIVSPDNIDINTHGEMLLCEDPNFTLDTDLGLTRDSSIWGYKIGTGTLKRIAEINRARAIAHALRADSANAMDATRNKPGAWETSGVIDVEAFYGRGAWLFDVQAHGLQINPVGETVEGGQILMLRWNP